MCTHKSLHHTTSDRHRATPAQTSSARQPQRGLKIKTGTEPLHSAGWNIHIRDTAETNRKSHTISEAGITELDRTATFVQLWKLNSELKTLRWLLHCKIGLTLDA